MSTEKKTLRYFRTRRASACALAVMISVSLLAGCADSSSSGSTSKAETTLSTSVTTVTETPAVTTQSETVTTTTSETVTTTVTETVSEPEVVKEPESSLEFAKKCCSSNNYEYLGTLENGDKMQKVYDALKEVCLDAWEHTDRDYDDAETNSHDEYCCKIFDDGEFDLGPRDLALAGAMFERDNPIFYFAVPTVCAPITENGEQIYLSVAIGDDFLKGSFRAEIQKAIQEKVTAISGTASAGKNQYERERMAYDGVVQAVEYAYDEDGEELQNGLTSTAAGVHNGELICEGYAKLYKTVLDYMDLPCWFVEGKEIEHAWNIIGIDGKYYYADATWDDAYVETTYNYFAKGSQVFNEDHCTDIPEPFKYMNGLPKVEEDSYTDEDYPE
ncbi:MAG: hypothetical protein IKO27_03845 [Ruminococcus sp.]|nr:hypothetical protein [Ruminococcus sp.]